VRSCRCGHCKALSPAFQKVADNLQARARLSPIGSPPWLSRCAHHCKRSGCGNRCANAPNPRPLPRLQLGRWSLTSVPGCLRAARGNAGHTAPPCGIPAAASGARMPKSQPLTSQLCLQALVVQGRGRGGLRRGGQQAAVRPLRRQGLPHAQAVRAAAAGQPVHEEGRQVALRLQRCAARWGACRIRDTAVAEPLHEVLHLQLNKQLARRKGAGMHGRT